MPTVAELLAMPYDGGSPPSNGFTADDYREQYRNFGRPFRWWVAYELSDSSTGPEGAVIEPNGCCYVEQVNALNGEPMTDIRAMFWSTSRNVPHEEFGYVSIGDTQMSVMPDECELVRMDRVSFTDVSWITRSIVKYGDLLPRKPIAGIDSIVNDGVLVDPNIYSVNGTDTGITWHSAAPVADVAALQAVIAANREDGQARVVSSSGRTYWFDADGMTGLKPDDLTDEEPGRWVIVAVGAGVPVNGDYLTIQYRYYPVFEVIGTERAVVQKGADNKYLPQRVSVRMMRAGENITTF